jgi:tRNA pseudouridine38-40 synthase
LPFYKINVQRYFLKISYLGTNYHGWQVQENAHSVQAELNAALKTFFREEPETVGCGRTDTGVHAKEFFVHFDLSFVIDDLSYALYKLNKLLPNDIACQELFLVKQDAHARFSAISRSYEYNIILKKDPFLYNRTYFHYGELNVGQMNQACEILMRYDDFSSFSKSRTQVKTNICKIKEAYWVQKGDILIFNITADRFLRNMVRAIVGTMVDIGKGKNEIETMKTIIEGKNRSDAGVSVPAGGLYLTNVVYPEDIKL